MKNYLLAILFLISIKLMGQTDGMSYQAVILNPPGVGIELPGENDYNGVYKNKPLEVKFTILNTSGTVDYQETHFTTTDSYGMINLIIGSGNVLEGVYTEIFWDGTSKDLKVEISFGANFEELSTQALLYTPYALHRDIIATGDLTVYGSTLFSGDLTVDGITNLNNSLSVNNGTPTNLSGSLIVEGESLLNNDLNVTGVSNLNNNLNVNGISNLNNELNVTGITNLDNTLNVAGVSNLNNDLNVLGITNLNNTFNVEGVSNLNNELNVTSHTFLNSTLNVLGISTLYDDLNVLGVTTLNNTLNVSGISNLNDDLNVTGATNLNNSLDVAGVSNLNDDLNVTGVANLNNTLNVAGVSNLNNALNVTNNSPTSLSGSLLVTGTTTLNDPLFANGQVTINAALSGGEGSYNAYPLRVEGSAQGIAIKLSANTPNRNNNFVTFFNNSGSAIGRIEGQTAADVSVDPEFIYQEAILVAEEVKAIANVPLAAIPVVVAGIGASAGPCGACIAMAAADLILATANLVSFNVFAFENMGVTYQSGSADYAEWLERRNPMEDIRPGEIVGVNAGKISKYTADSNLFMVVSTKPAVLGNMPVKSEEHLYEKVAFMGQIPVRVKGIVYTGDFILPSGNNDGLGIAVSPESIKPKQYKQIIGVAWSPALFDNGTFSIINMAIGLKSNDIASLVEKHEERILALENDYKSLKQHLLALEAGKPFKPSANETTTVSAKKYANNNRELLAANMPSELTDEILDEAMLYLENAYKDNGIDISKHAGLNTLFNNPAQRSIILRKTKEKYKKMAQRYN